MTGTGARTPSDDDVPHRGANPFRLLPYESEPFPFQSSIHWRPRKSWVIQERTVARPDIVIAQRALETIDELRSDHAWGEAIGVLLGHLYECPWTRRRWVHAVGTSGASLPAEFRFDEEAPAGEETERDWVLADALDTRLRHPDWAGALPVGWFRCRNGAACFLTEGEADLHARHFREPWQFGTLVLYRPEKPTIRRGMVFVSNEGGEAIDRPWSFYEGLDPSTNEEDHSLRSRVVWQEYVTDRPVSPVPSRMRSRDRGRRGTSPGAGSAPSRTWRRLTAGIAVSALLATGAWLFLDGAPWGPPKVAPPVSYEALGEFAAPPGAVAPELFESFRQAAFRYFDLSDAFRRGETDCARLAAAYGSARSALDAIVTELPGGAEPTESSSRVGGVVEATAREIEASFARSRCEAP